METSIVLTYGSLTMSIIDGLIGSLQDSKDRAKRCLAIQDKDRAKALLTETMEDLRRTGRGISQVAEAYLQLSSR